MSKSKIKRGFLRGKEIKNLLAQFSKATKSYTLQKQLQTSKSPVEYVKSNNEEIFIVDKELIFAKAKNRIFPTLNSVRLLSNMPKAVVDMGAVPHISNGADIMAPGVVRFEGDFEKEELVIVCDERHQKPIAITIAIYDREESEKSKRGKILQNVHYVGDGLWRLMKQIQ